MSSGELLASVMTTRVRAPIGKLAKGMRSRLRAVTNLGLRLLQCCFCWRYWFGGAKVVHVAFDAVRVHGLSMMMGFITLLGGVGAWLPLRARANHQQPAVGNPGAGQRPSPREAKKPPVFLVKRLAHKVFTRDLDHIKIFWLVARCLP